MVGRRNWLFADTVGGANASANLYSPIETAKANGLDPYRYLCALFAALPKATKLEDYEAASLAHQARSRQRLRSGGDFERKDVVR